ncbi:hypothetical protein A259_11389 [Pseudomonas syringae pv. actinidiae ICMP 19070]|nr:hypothetical protein A259_11389 [Pseudomonas syringae pv. actinidiae ICMP 19070]
MSRTGQIAIGNVVGNGVIEQRDVLIDLGDVPAQIAQTVVVDFDAIEQDVAHLVPVKTRYQVGQGRFAAAGTSHQRDHLPGCCRETDVVQHLTLGLRVEEAEVLHLQMAADAITLDRTDVDLFLHVQLLEDTFGTSDAFLDGRADFRQLANRLGQ